MTTDDHLGEELRQLDYGKLKEARPIQSLAREMEFTAVHREHESSPRWLREVKCLEAQVRLTLMPIQPGDWFAGRLDRMYVGIDPERGDLTEAAYFCKSQPLKELSGASELNPGLRSDIRSLLEYWEPRATYRRCREQFTPRMRQGLPSDDYYGGLEISFPMFGLGGPCLDFGKLTRLGLTGLREQVARRCERAVQEGESDLSFYDSLAAGLDIVIGAALRYSDDARKLAAAAVDPEEREGLRMIAESLGQVASRPPVGYHQAIQLLWLDAVCALPKNYGRLDVVLGDFLAHDLNSGELSEEEALRITIGFWRMIVTRGDNFNNRIIIGGMGRPNPDNADRFTRIALEAQRIVHETIPQLSLRWYEGMAPALLTRALEVLGEGTTFPIVYNDDANVPAVAKAFGVSREEAEQYIMYGCGEYVLDHRSIGSPDAAMNVAKALDVTLHNGHDSFTGQKKGLALGAFRDFVTFEQLQEAVVRQIENQVELLAEAQAVNYRVTGEEAIFPLLSLLYDDCLERGKPLLAGGVRYLGGTLESFGNNTTADSLFAIQQLVYERRVLTADQLLKMLDLDFDGFERERRQLLDVPKYGNDHSGADAMSLWLNRVTCEAAQRQAARVGLDSFLVVMINNGDSVLFGKTTGATADGRRRGAPLSNGNQPGAGYDRNGVTALLNSMAKLEPSLHAGATHNIKLGRSLFRTRLSELKALLKGYFAQGGTQLMVTVTDRRDLEEALEYPDQYSNLLVRIGGYSERFVNLPREIQQEVIRRTLY